MQKFINKRKYEIYIFRTFYSEFSQTNGPLFNAFNHGERVVELFRDLNATYVCFPFFAPARERKRERKRELVFSIPRWIVHLKSPERRNRPGESYIWNKGKGAKREKEGKKCVRNAASRIRDTSLVIFHFYRPLSHWSPRYIFPLCKTLHLLKDLKCALWSTDMHCTYHFHYGRQVFKD